MSRVRFDTAAWRAAAELLRARDEAAGAFAIASSAAILLDGARACVWLFDHARGYRLSGYWPHTGSPPSEPPADVARAAMLGTPIAGPTAPPFRSRLLIPLESGGRPVGALEVLESTRPGGALVPLVVDELGGFLDTASAALLALRTAGIRERSHLETIERLSRLYDLSRSLAVTSGADGPGERIVGRVLGSLDVDGAYLWTPHDDGTLVVSAAGGLTADAVLGARSALDAGLAGRAASTNELCSVEDSEEIPDPEHRQDVAAGFTVHAAMAAPLLESDILEGVLEVVQCREASGFSKGDGLFLKEIAAVAATALSNARRLESERRASDLTALLELSQELSASLDPTQVCFTLVHKAAAVLTYDTAAVSLLRAGRMEIAAISDHSFVDSALPRVRAMRDVLAWSAGLDDGFYVVQDDDGTIDSEKPETREMFREYFAASATRSFLAIPLRDEQGLLGIFALESETPYAFPAREFEAAGLLAVQATVAIRNATLYAQIPKSGTFGPLTARSPRLAAFARTRPVAATAAAAALIGLLALPLPLRLAGNARVLPSRRIPATPEVDGRIARVLVREGDRVRPGQVLAELDDTDYRASRDDAKARLEAAMVEASRLRSDGKTSEGAEAAARADGYRAALALSEKRLRATSIRAPEGGVVATPRIEETEGSRLARGTPFCELVDPARQLVEVAIPEPDAALVASGMPVKIKLNAYASDSIRGTVERVGMTVAVDGTDRNVLVRVRLEDGTRPLISGLSGRAKVTAGRVPFVRVLLRRPVRWLWGLIWGWLP